MNMILISTLTAILFFGGWQSPVDSPLFNLLPPFGWLLLKVFFIVSMFLWIRADVPALSLRPDHAPGLEGVHPADAGVDRVHRRVDADAVEPVEVRPRWTG
jgi:hypothetical protein